MAIAEPATRPAAQERKPDEPANKTADPPVPESTSATPAPAPSAADAGHASSGSTYDRGIMLQAFNWESCKKGGWYTTIQGKVQDIKDLGFTHIWLPPPSQSVAPQGYLPGQLYNLNSKYGSPEQLVELIKAFKAAGVKTIADIVINHRCADEKGPDGVYNVYRDDVDHEGNNIDWGQWAITGNDPHFNGTGNPDTGEDYGPAPDLDHKNEGLRTALKHWMQHLKDDIGYDSWRFDFSKGYGAKYTQEYIEATVGGQQLNVGEIWVDMAYNDGNLDYNQNGGRQLLCDWINGTSKTSCAFDFPTKGILQEAVKSAQYNRLRDGEGKAPGLIGWWPSKAVTFVDNHDTGSTQNHWPFPADNVAIGYAYILTHPGVPCVLWDHMYDWGEELRNTIAGLIALRQRAGLQADSKLEILAADGDFYVARIGGRVTIKMGPRCEMGDLLPKEAEGWKVSLSGKDWAIWEKDA